MSLLDLTALELGAKIKAGEVSVPEATRAALDAIEAKNAENNAFITVLNDRAMAQAEEIQKKISRGELTSPLAGVPLAIKDNICTKGVKTTCASKILGDFTPPYDATLTETWTNLPWAPPRRPPSTAPPATPGI